MIVPTNLPAVSQSKRDFASGIGRVLLGVYIVSLAIVCGLLVVNGPGMRAAVEAEQVRITEVENHAFCTTFGVGPGTDRYAQCASELAQIRARHLERYLRDSIL
jgi:hypothetical protein